MQLTKYSSETLDIFRIPLAIGVLCSHAYVGIADDVNFFYFNSYLDRFSYYVLKIFSSMLPPLVVPGFFLLSGYFFFLKWDEQHGSKIWCWATYKEKLSKRVFTLLHPYIIWNILPVLLGMIGYIFTHFSENKPIIEIVYSYLQGKGLRIFWSFYELGTSGTILGVIPLSISTAPYNFPLYYLRDLMGICILSPLVFIFVKKLKCVGMIFLILLGILGLLPSYPGLRSSALLYFSFGAYFSINNIDIVEKIKGRIDILSIIFLAILCLIVKENCSCQVQNLYVMIGLVLLLRLVTKLVLRYNISSPKYIVSGIFFFYVAHEGLYLLHVGQFLVCNIIPPLSYFNVLIGYVLTIILTFILCYIVRNILKKWMPKLSVYLGA